MGNSHAFIDLVDRFYRLIEPSRPNEWEVEDVLEPLLELPVDKQGMILDYVNAVWPISHSLCFSYLHYGRVHGEKLDTEGFAEWVRQLLYHYECKGLRGSREFMVRPAVEELAALRDRSSVELETIRNQLLPFIRGVSGQALEIESGPIPWTDTSTLFLPEKVHIFPSESANRNFYLYMACCQWGYMTLGSLRSEIIANSCKDKGSSGQIVASDPVELDDLFAQYPDSKLAERTYLIHEYARVFRMLSTELPGLMRRVLPLLRSLLQSGNAQLPWRVVLTELIAGDEGSGSSPQGMRLRTIGSRAESLAALSEGYGWWLDGGFEEDLDLFGLICGRLNMSGVRERVRLRRKDEKEKFEQVLAEVISDFYSKQGEQGELNEGGAEDGGDGIRVVLGDFQDGESRSDLLTIDNEGVTIPEELSSLINSIRDDLGHVPDGYVQAAAGLAGQGYIRGDGGADDGSSLAGRNFVLYDEWDFRRSGYRRDWCGVYEKDLQPVRSTFVEQALQHHRGILVKLRRQFEMLRTEHRFVRRRRHGDDLDFDALVDAMGDKVAGLAPTDRLFIRLLRDERDIAVCFLVDMSNSTQGWIGRAIKESLALLCEVLEVVGDRYAIYGFSGMRRSRCDLYRIKRMDESYGTEVKNRICAMQPLEYTRMGPPIRHLTRMLCRTEAKVRLLITLSDGKPEDYDDYSGEYAIEDTKKALNEARGSGVIPFCITIDSMAHEYLGHMFGRGNYIFVDSVEKLPARMPEIYRLLTS